MLADNLITTRLTTHSPPHSLAHSWTCFRCTPTAVKTILPFLYEGLLDSNWQVKEGTLKCLGWLADTQRGAVGACLVDIVPKVSDCLGDTKKQVASAARKACGKACLVIDNPDILPIVPDVIKTIGDIGKTEATMD